MMNLETVTFFDDFAFAYNYNHYYNFVLKMMQYHEKQMKKKNGNLG